jgi:bifunctional UDP-N-acetylglucosamine pyrophosphorylase/glucosamine-1-phosphate N-acetyltransferase
MGGKPCPLAVVILAAGRGTRMKSGRAKVLHEVAGRPMLAYPLEAAQALSPQRLVVVVGQGEELVRERFEDRAVFVAQEEPRGTGHAVLAAREVLQGFAGDVMILCGDTPLLREGTLRRMREVKLEGDAELLLLSASAPLPGRVVRDEQGRVVRIVEETDAAPEELAIEEGNAGVYLVDAGLLWKALSEVDDRNAQGEIYLTDVVQRVFSSGRSVEALRLDDPEESLGVNTRAELAEAAAIWRRRTAERLMREGVTLIDPQATYLDVDVQVGRDTVIEPGCVLKGDTRIGERVHVKAHTTIEWSRIEDDVEIGPSAHLRPGTVVGSGARVGNFVEVKNSVIGENVKADHLSYIGDAEVGSGASFGCGSITVNFDGREKHRTTIGPDAFIGCNANLIAPVTVGRDAYVAAGSTVTQDVPEEALAVGRSRQRNVEGWSKRRPRKRK